MEKIRMAVVGYGQRGSYVTVHSLHFIDSIEVTAICDLYQDRVDKGVEENEKKYGNKVLGTLDYHDVLNSDNVDAVYVACSWEYHIEVAIEAMKKGKIVALEVGGAYSIDELHRLVRTYEDTKTPIMFMENCCFDKFELLTTAAVRAGKLGKIVHCHGSYAHDLRNEISSGNIIRHYRLRNYTNRNSENYPTHELGPIAKLLNINRGNRMLSLVSVASSAAGLEQYVKDHPDLVEKDPTLEGRRFKQGDIVNSVITCAGGETIALTLDTTLPRPFYSRSFSIRGTHGMCDESRRVIFLDGMKEPVENNEDEVMAQYDHPIHKEYRSGDALGDHDGMDWLVSRAFIESVKAGTETPIDAYDTVSLMAIAPLSEESVRKGGAPVEIPDFTNGKWFRRAPLVAQKYSLDEVCEDDRISIWGDYRK
jgi:predicted dehydrogenase